MVSMIAAAVDGESDVDGLVAGVVACLYNHCLPRLRFYCCHCDCDCDCDCYYY